MLDLSSFDTVRVTFLRRGEIFTQRQPRGTERNDDLEYFFQVTDAGKVLLNGQDLAEPGQWKPDRGSLKTLFLELDEPIIARLKPIRDKLRPVSPPDAQAKGPQTLTEAADYLRKTDRLVEIPGACVAYEGVFYFSGGTTRKYDTNFLSGYAIQKGDTAISTGKSPGLEVESGYGF